MNCKTEIATLNCQKDKCTVKKYKKQAQGTSERKHFFIQFSKVELRSDADMGEKSFKILVSAEIFPTRPKLQTQPPKETPTSLNFLKFSLDRGVSGHHRITSAAV